MADAAPAHWQNLNEGERLVSALGGAVLLGYGLARRPSPMSAVLAAAGVLALERGLTGHCSLYRALGIDRSDSGGALSRRAHSVMDHVERAVDESFPASDPPSWSPTSAGSPAEAG
jgi:hypothetical protein